MEGHQESLAVASVAQDHGAAVVDRGAVGTRPGDLDTRIRPLPSTRHPRVFVDAAGPCGAWRSRDLTNQGHVCRVVAPSLLPNTAGDRVTTDRRDAVPWARRRRAGDRTPVAVPTVDDDARRARTRAREEASGALTAATCRLNAVWRRHASRSTGQATWGPAHLSWHRVAPPPRGRGPPGRAWRAVSGGRHDGGGAGGPHPRRDPQSAHALLGPDPRRLFAGGAPPPGGEYHSRPDPSSGPPRRRLGLSRAGAGQSPPATAPRPTVQRHPGQPLDGPRAAVSTRPHPERPRQPGPPRRGRHGPGTGGRAVGQCPAGARDTRRLTDTRPRATRTEEGAHGPWQRRRPGVVSPSTA